MENDTTKLAADVRPSEPQGNEGDAGTSPSNPYFGSEPRGYNDCVACGEPALDSLLCGWCAAGAEEYNASPDSVKTDPDFDVGVLDYWRRAGENLAEDEQEKAWDKELESKLVSYREGSALRNVEELEDLFVNEACAILKITRPKEDEFCQDEDCIESHDEIASEYEDKLEEAGYSVFWSDGYWIYNDLSDDAAEYMARSLP